MCSPLFERTLLPGLLAMALLTGCESELTCDETPEFVLGGVKTRYATSLTLLSEDGVVVGVSGQNDRGLSFSLRVPAGTDLMASTTLDVATLADGLTYIECSGSVPPARCTLSESQAMQLVARAGTVTITTKSKAINAQFDLSEVTVTGGDEGQAAHGCFQVTDSRSSAAGASSN